jgi:hypothetical protein
VVDQDGGDEQLAYWREVATQRGHAIRSLHEFNYWHQATVARGEVIAGLEESLAEWRERALAAEAALTTATGDSLARRARSTMAQLTRGLRRVTRPTLRDS